MATGSGPGATICGAVANSSATTEESCWEDCGVGGMRQMDGGGSGGAISVSGSWEGTGSGPGRAGLGTSSMRQSTPKSEGDVEVWGMERGMIGLSSSSSDQKFGIEGVADQVKVGAAGSIRIFSGTSRRQLLMVILPRNVSSAPVTRCT